MDVHDPLTERVIGCAIAVHRALGPGLVEATYEEALCIELTEERLRSRDKYAYQSYIVEGSSGNTDRISLLRMPL